MLCGSLDGRGVWGQTDTRICTAESLCCSPETGTTLLVGYTAIQNKRALKNNLQALFPPRVSKWISTGSLLPMVANNFLNTSFFFFFFSSPEKYVRAGALSSWEAAQPSPW